MAKVTAAYRHSWNTHTIAKNGAANYSQKQTFTTFNFKLWWPLTRPSYLHISHSASCSRSVLRNEIIDNIWQWYWLLRLWNNSHTITLTHLVPGGHLVSVTLSPQPISTRRLNFSTSPWLLHYYSFILVALLLWTVAGLLLRALPVIWERGGNNYPLPGDELVRKGKQWEQAINGLTPDS